MGDEYHKNYNELITLEKTLNGQITELQKCLDAKTNSIKLEMQIKVKSSWKGRRKTQK